jgi:EpsG family
VIGSAARYPVQRALVVPFIALLAAFAAFRGYVGTDTYAYHEMFQYFRQDGLLEIAGSLEPVFAVIIKTTSYVSTSSFVFVGAVAIVQSVVLYMIVTRHSRPLLFLGIYAATFYINFQFNILRAGLAALLLVLALGYLLSGSRPKFFGSGLLSVFSHYSSMLFFIPMTLVGQRLRWAAPWFLISIIAGGVVAWNLIGEERWIQYLSYLVLFDLDDAVPYGFGLLVAFILYATIFVLQVTKENAFLLTFLLLTWYAARIASNYLLFIDRIEVVLNIILLYLLFQKPVLVRNRAPLLTACILLITLNLYGTLRGLEAADLSQRGGPAADSDRISSTYLPYRFAWEE